jgi:hypothetical protein
MWWRYLIEHAYYRPGSSRSRCIRATQRSLHYHSFGFASGKTALYETEPSGKKSNS